MRPPGHHAERERGDGLLFLQQHRRRRGACPGRAHGLSRVAVVDFDVHHGNGTEDIFKGDPRVLMVSTFQHPFYPYSGTEKPGFQHAQRAAQPAGTDGEEFREVVSEFWMPRLREFQPEMIFISAGFDAHYEDDMGGCGCSRS
jgi:acetoin utilization deacetylase AcuC-like enzyme